MVSGCHARHGQPYLEKLYVKCPKNTMTDLGWSRIWKAKLTVIGRPTLAPEQQLAIPPSYRNQLIRVTIVSVCYSVHWLTGVKLELNGNNPQQSNGLIVRAGQPCGHTNRPLIRVTLVCWIWSLHRHFSFNFALPTAGWRDNKCRFL